MIGIPAILCFALALGCLIAARWAVRRSRYRVGQTPRCRRCEYILISPSGRCPECGTELSFGEVVYGERRRSVGWSVVAGVTLIAAAMLSASAGRQVDWYRLRPTAWLMRDLNSSIPGTPDRAWAELDRRYNADGLSPEQRSKVIDVCLAEQIAPVKGRLRQGMLELLYTQAARRLLTPGQEARFYGGATDVTLQTRARVPAGKPVPCTLVNSGRGPGGVHVDQWWRSWYCRTGNAPLLLDGVPTGQRLGGGGVSGEGAVRSNGITVPPPAVGHHVFTIDLPITIALRSENPDAPTEEPRASFTRQLTAAFDVLPPPVGATTRP